MKASQPVQANSQLTPVAQTQLKSSLSLSGEQEVISDNRPEAFIQRRQIGIIQRKSSESDAEETVQRISFPTVQRKENKTGLPDQLKSGIENLSGIGMDDVMVHYNSSKPAQLNALAYAQGTDIHIGSGQEKHLPHEAWHVVQQKQGRVKPTIQMKTGTPVNDDPGLEKEADVMGSKAMGFSAGAAPGMFSSDTLFTPVVQRTSELSRYIVEQLFLAAALELAMVDESMLNIIIGARQYLSEEEQPRNDWGDAYKAFIAVYTGILKMGERYIVIAEAFRVTLFERIQAAETDGAFPAQPLREYVLKLFQVTASTRARLEMLKKKAPEKLDEDEEDNDDDEKEAIDWKVWKLADVEKLLDTSTPLHPLSDKQLDALKQWLDYYRTSVLRSKSREIHDRIKKADGDRGQYLQMISSTRPKTKKSRGPRKEKVIKFTFGDEDSDTGSVDFSADSRLSRHPASMASMTGRSHVYGIEDPERFRHLVTGLPYADTYLGLFKDGSLVPRLIDGEPNVDGHRKRMGNVEEVIAPLLKKRDAFFAELDRLNGEISSGDFVEDELAQRITQRNKTFEELQTLLREEIRPHVEALVFGSSSGAGPTNEDIEATGDNSKARGAIRVSLTEESVPSAAASMFQSFPPGGLSTGADSHTHAEQSLINTRLWAGLVDQLVAAISSNEDAPEQISQSSFTTLQLVINRSTCIGCARELTTELIRFWMAVAKSLGLDNWRRAKYIYEDYIRFQVDFPAVYEDSAESGSGYRNFSRIILGLRDAGWQVQVITGIKTGTSSDETNESAKKRVAGLNSIPMFFVPDWNEKIVRFPVPEALASAVEHSSHIMINGILYWRTEDSESLTRDSEQEENSIDAEAIAKMQFLKTGAAVKHASSDADHKMALAPQTALGKKFQANWQEQLQYDEGLQQMMHNGYEIRNVSGRGMNCLIRSIFVAAGIDYDEEQVKIVRQYLIEQGVADGGDMLDLLGAEGLTLIQFMQLQGILPGGTGLTVHFSGGSMEVVPGDNQIHIWYANAHFQAIVHNE